MAATATLVYGDGRMVPKQGGGGVGAPTDKLLAVGGGDGEPYDMLGGFGDATPRLMLESESESSQCAVGLRDVSLKRRGLDDNLLEMRPLCECLEWPS